MKVLLVEDDLELCGMLSGYLTAESFEVDCAHDGEQACALFDLGTYHIILLDLMIPKRCGMDVMQHIRRRSTVPILILSAKDQEADKALGLGLGADDYITKPFSLIEVLARIKANIRRTTEYAMQPQDAQPLSFRSLRMDLAEHTVTKDGNRLELTAKEFDILKLFLQNPRRVYTKAQIYSLIWKDAYVGDENAVNVHISRLRNKIEDSPRSPTYIVTVWGIGYKLGDAP